MEQNEDRSSDKAEPKYVWDAQKLAWVEATATPSEAQAVQEIPEKEVAAERVRVEAFEEIAPQLYKGVLIRLGAGIIDLIVISIIDTIIRYTVGQVVDLPNFVLPIYGLLYFVGLWLWRGQTIGLILIGAKVVRMDGTRVSADRAFLRYLFYLLPLYSPIVFFAGSYSSWFVFILPFVGLVVMGLNRQKRGIHDFIAGTCVIDTRAPVSQPQEVESTEARQPETSESETPEQE